MLDDCSAEDIVHGGKEKFLNKVQGIPRKKDNEPEFIDEMIQFKYFILQLQDAGKNKIVPAEELYKMIVGNMAQCNT